MIPPERSAEFVAAMEDVLDVYHRPYDPRHPQLNLDELHTQLVRETRTVIPARPHYHTRYDYEYERMGTANVFCIFEPLTNRRILKVTDRRTRRDWAEVVRELVDVHYPDAETVVLVMDNLNTHTIASLYEAFAPEEARRIARKLELHFMGDWGWANLHRMAGWLGSQVMECAAPGSRYAIWSTPFAASETVTAVAEGEVRDHRALEAVAAVDQHRAFGVLGAQPLEVGREHRRAAERAPLAPRARLDRAVEVGGLEHPHGGEARVGDDAHHLRARERIAPHVDAHPRE